MVLVLGIETATAQSSVCLGTPQGVVASACLGRRQAHAEFIAPAIRFCLRQAGASIEEVQGVAVSLGPGLFTGMRVGIATAQALAHARGLPVVGLNTLDLVAYPLRHGPPDRSVFAVVDARRGELFWGRYRISEAGAQRSGEVRIGPADKLAGEIESAGQDVVCVGDGALAHERLLQAAGARVATPWLGHPSAQAVVELSLPRFLREDTQRPEDLRPVYVRLADARISWRNRGALFGGKQPAAEAP